MRTTIDISLIPLALFGAALFIEKARDNCRTVWLETHNLYNLNGQMEQATQVTQVTQVTKANFSIFLATAAPPFSA